MTKNYKSELLLPVGNMNMCLAAIHNGADAIYVGMPEFNARGRTADFNTAELKEMIEICHLYGVKVNLAFNVIIFQEEFEKIKELLIQVLPLAPDAIIVQDIGLAFLIRSMSHEQTLHGSTQMTVTNHEAMSLLSDLSIKRFVLGREVSISEMRLIKEKTPCELEVFVHGALCVAYSGQCFTSESIGGRSANRGQCAQSCRFEYDLMVDGHRHELGEKKYLVSPKDLCGIAQIPDLLNLEIKSFKVEGRLKTPEYVAAAARNYREAIDQALLDKTLSKKRIDDAKREMGLTYSRGFYSGWLNGVNHQELVDGTFGAHRGVDIGIVQAVHSKSIIIKSSYQKLKNGDGVLFAGNLQGSKMEIGGKIYQVSIKNDSSFELFFARDFEFLKIRPGFKVYLNHDATVFKELTQSYTDKNSKKKIAIEINVRAFVGLPLEVFVSDGFHRINLKSEGEVEPSRERPTSLTDLESELGALSATCFKLNKLVLDGDNLIFIHQKELKSLRRKFTEELMKKRIERSAPLLMPPEDLFHTKQTQKSAPLHFNILLREFIQVQELLTYIDQIREGLGIVYLDYEFGKDCGSSVSMLKQAKVKVGIATTRILKPNEYHNFKVIERASPDVILCRNLGAIEYFKDGPFELRGDFSLNVTNSLTANYLMKKNLKSVCASYDLNARQLHHLLDHMKSGSLEVTIHQYMPSFHMEHCVFAAVLSNGSSFKDCGKPCEKHRVELRDQFGNFHQIKADQECRNTMFNSTSQSAARLIPGFKKLGLSEFRFEALYERGKSLKDKILSCYQLVIDDSNNDNEELFTRLDSLEKYGLSDKHFDNRKYKNKKIK